MTELAIKVRNLKKSYDKLKVLKGVNLDVERGTIVALLGPNGAGKTTIVKILSTLLHQYSGSVVVGGYDVASDSAKVRRVIGLTGQDTAVDEYLSGRENLVMIGLLYRLGKSSSKKRAEDLLNLFDLTKAADRPAKTYSGGMRRRLDLAISLIAEPPILFLDEPTTGLDPRSRLAIWSIVKNLVSEGATILLTTQYLDEADQLADKIIVMDDGKIIAQGTADELKRKVGAERLDITISQKSDFKKASKIVGSKDAQSDESKRMLSLANYGGASHLKDLLVSLEKADIKVDALSLHKPTLDNVFLTLTGKKASDKSIQSKPKDANV